MTDRQFVIVGAGLAGAKAAERLREHGFDGPITLVGDETDRPYERPPLSKEYLAGDAERDSVFVHEADWYRQNRVELRLGCVAESIDRAARQVSLSTGEQISYAKLLLATGSAPKALPVPGGDAEGVHYLRRLGDCERIKDAISAASRLVVIGGGWIGLEVAAAARQAGVDVIVLEAAELPLLGALGPEMARVFASLHTEHGVDLRTGVRIDRVLTEQGRAVGVQLADGTRIDADAIVAGVGIAPNVGLAKAAGLEVDDGVVVDAGLRTSDPDVFAAGDVASAHHPLLGRRIRVEHWANALNQPDTAAQSMLGREVSYAELPYFFTDQYDLGMEYHGYVEPGGYDRVVVRGDAAAREFVAFWLRDGRVLAGMNVNVWDVGEPVKTMIRSGVMVDVDRLVDVDTPLGSARIVRHGN